MKNVTLWASCISLGCMFSIDCHAQELERVAYNHPGLVVDLGVGLWSWPLPMDYDNDGDMDLLVSCPDKPYNGTYFFENSDGPVKFPVFKAGVRIADGYENISVSRVDKTDRILVPGHEFVHFIKNAFNVQENIYPSNNLLPEGSKIRTNQWKWTDYDLDGQLDIIVGVGDWTAYGWDDAYNLKGEWTNGPLHGWVFLIRQGLNKTWDPPVRIHADGKPIDVFGRPSPNLADFDNDGDLDLLCGEFLDGFTYFKNSGTRTNPRYEAGRRLCYQGMPLHMDVEMIVPTAVDWDLDGDVDLVVGDEDGRVALLEHTGTLEDGLPVFLPPEYFQQHAADVKFGALATPSVYDWDGDGDEDIICGNTAGQIAWIENSSHQGVEKPRWEKPRLLKAGKQIIRIMAGSNGSIQGPCEAKWGYTTLSVGDWDHDTLPDLIVNSIWGKVIWYRNVGTREDPQLRPAQAIEVAWGDDSPPRPAWNWWKPMGNELITQWRTTPVVVDWNGDGLNDLVMLDHEGYLCFWQRSLRSGKQILLPPRRMFIDRSGLPIRLNDGYAGASGRRKLAVTDWDGDGDLDVLINSMNADFMENVSEKEGQVVLVNRNAVAKRPIAGHTSSPTVADFNNDQVPDLLVGAEDGYLYYLRNPRRASNRSD